MKRLFCYILFLFSSVVLFSQNIDVKKLIISGDAEFAKMNYYGAARLYDDALAQNRRMYEVVWKAAESYRLDNDYAKAAKHYRYLVDKTASNFPLAYYHYAQMLKSRQDYIRAQNYFKKYVYAPNIDSSSENIYFKRALHEIDYCSKAWKIISLPNGFEIFQCDSSINTVYSDFSSAFLGDSILYFSSIKPDVDSNYNSKIYNINFFDTIRSEAKMLNENFNIPGFDVSNPHFSKSGKLMYFTISDVYNGNNTFIYKSIFKNGIWVLPEKLPSPINVEGANSTHPFLLERENENDILLWSSDCVGGDGGFDLYFCEMLGDDIYGMKRNLGRPIIEDTKFRAFYDTTSVVNSLGNEICPFYMEEDSCLYFSSDWHQGLGGYDIFKVKGDFISWENIENLGYPTNTAQNDYYYKMYPKLGLAFLSSNRKSSFSKAKESCCNDIYYHNIDKTIDVKLVEELITTTMSERIKLLVPITLYFDNDRPNPRCMDTITETSYEDLFYNYINKIDVFRQNFAKGLSGQKKQAALDSIDNFFSTMVQENFDKLLEFISLMKELVERDQNVIITIKGYTSPLNTAEYNNALAKRRISSLVNYILLIDNGYFKKHIASEKIKFNFVSFGKTFSAGKVSEDPNDTRNSVYSPAASKERRIEIIAVSVEK